MTEPPAAERERLLKLAVIGTAAGIFSGLFGVGGGSVIVPLLIVWLAYQEHAATGTSLAALGIVALLAALVQAVYGNVDAAEAGLVAVPAIVGVLAGTAAQQRVPARAISGIFSVVLLAVAVELAIP
jgi:uncharacterized membrane protein YfcA